VNAVLIFLTHRYYYILHINLHMNKQTSLKLQSWSKDRFTFGASLLKGSHPKKKRPFSSKFPMHSVMRSSKACGNSSFLLHNKSLSKVLEKQSARHFVKIYSLANAGNHLHLIVQAPSREHLAAFLRAITGRIAQLLATHVCLPFLAAQASKHAQPENQASKHAQPENQASIHAQPRSSRLLGRAPLL